jgi:glycosyltransferase involved in cell wall biosynthesis
LASPTPKLLYVVNIPRFFVSHRLSLALAAQQAGFNVHVATSDHDSENVQRIIDSGLTFHPLPLSQHGTSPLQELRTLNAIRRLYSTLEPDLVHHVSIKPVIYGGIAAKLTRRKAIVNAMSGLGYVFIGTGLKPRLLRLLTRPAFKFAMHGENTRMIFQNPDDQQVFVDNGLVNPQQGVLIRGSGVDEHHFAATDENMQGLPVVLFAGRLLWQKGIGEFAEVARRLKGKARFIVYGYEEATSPLNVPASQLQAWQDEGILEWGGKRDDMPNAYAEANIICLPSTYGEGVPKVLIEAASCARACVTTDTPGCREIVHDQENGLIVPPNDLDALTSAIDDLIMHPEKRQQMGTAGRQLVLKHFTFTQVAEATFKLYRTLLTP